MARSGAATKERILEVAYGLLYREGFARVSMDAVAAAAGVTKRTLYQHFDSKDALVGAVLERQNERALALIRAWGDADAESGAAVVTAVFAGLERWASRPRWLGSGYTRLSMELADLPGHPARVVARRHKQSVEAWLADELARVGVERPEQAAKQVAMLMEGCMTLMLIHGDRGYAQAAGALARLVVEPRGGD
jgi:AcrR family transcriptional regulator